MIKKAICFILIISLSLSLCGCWNNFDLEGLAIVVGVGFDKGDNGKIEVTAEVLNPSQGGSSNVSPGGGGSTRNSIVYMVEGTTFFDAIRNFIAKVSKRLYWNDVQVVVVGEDYAKGGISDILDFFQRDQQANLSSDLIVAKGMTAKEVFMAEPNIDKTDATQIDDALESTNSLGKNVDITLFDIVKQINKLKPCVVVGVIEPDTSKNDYCSSGSSGNSKSSGGSASSGEAELENMMVQGAAVLKNYKLAGYLNPDETRGFLFAENKIAGTIITVKNPEEKDKSVSVKLVRSSGNISTAFSDEKLKLKIEVKTSGAIGDQQGKGDLTSSSNNDLLTSEVKNEIKNQIESAVSASQKELKSDIFCFNKDIYQNHLSEWNKISSDWDNVYSKSAIEINVDFLIDRPGMTDKSLVQG